MAAKARPGKRYAYVDYVQCDWVGQYLKRLEE